MASSSIASAQPEESCTSTTSDARARESAAACTLTGESTASGGGSKTPKHKYAILFGYIGTGYQGMQKNPGAHTVEDVVEKALYDAGFIEEENYGKLAKIDWSRAARTDKGVHAAGQCVSAKLRIPEDNLDNAVEEVNKHLPEQIRVLDFHRVTKGFNAKNFCYERQYEYLLPTFVLRRDRPTFYIRVPFIRALGDEPVATLAVDDKQDPFANGEAQQHGREFGWNKARALGGPKPAFEGARITDISGKRQSLVFYVSLGRDRVVESASRERVNRATDKYQTGQAFQEGREAQWESTRRYSKALLQDEQAERSEQFRLGKKQLQLLRDLGEKFIGRLSFHNYTPRMTHGDASCFRIIREFEVSDPFLVDDIEYVRFRIRGQSFMLNQIRHMVGALIDVVRGKAPLWMIDISLSPVLVKLPLAPATGLFLHHCDFTSYNENRGNNVHGGLNYEEHTAIGKKLTIFKEEYIWKHIHRQVVEEKPFEQFLWEMETHPFKYNARRSCVDPDDRNSTHVSKTAKQISNYRKEAKFSSGRGRRRKRQRKG
eukprot:gb/GECG01004307.1/.p1 GENE.gb/GECG01004307.1/~~gb/GECG01004307.1/.p1  ORF type:complete len:544 (+),score=73.60 gb/GECG01004307.1/:1-1632(+)